MSSEIIAKKYQYRCTINAITEPLAMKYPKMGCHRINQSNDFHEKQNWTSVNDKSIFLPSGFCSKTLESIRDLCYS